MQKVIEPGTRLVFSDGLVGVDLTDFDHLFFLVLEVLEASSSHL